MASILFFLPSNSPPATRDALPRGFLILWKLRSGVGYGLCHAKVFLKASVPKFRILGNLSHDDNMGLFPCKAHTYAQEYQWQRCCSVAAGRKRIITYIRCYQVFKSPTSTALMHTLSTKLSQPRPGCVQEFSSLRWI